MQPASASFRSHHGAPNTCTPTPLHSVNFHSVNILFQLLQFNIVVHDFQGWPHSHSTNSKLEIIGKNYFYSQTGLSHCQQPASRLRRHSSRVNETPKGLLPTSLRFSCLSKVSWMVQSYHPLKWCLFNCSPSFDCRKDPVFGNSMEDIELCMWPLKRFHFLAGSNISWEVGCLIVGLPDGRVSSSWARESTSGTTPALLILRKAILATVGVNS